MRMHSANALASRMESSSYIIIVRVVTLWNNDANLHCQGQTTCCILADVVVRPVGRLRSPSRTIRILGDLLMSSSRSRKSFLGALLFSILLSWSATAQTQDSGRKILKKVPVAYPSILKSKGIGGLVRLKVFVKPDGSVRDSEVLGGNPILAESAQKSVMQWKFSPATSETALEISVTFDPHADSGD